jgi:hypothetical protein
MKGPAVLHRRIDSAETTQNSRNRRAHYTHWRLAVPDLTTKLTAHRQCVFSKPQVSAANQLPREDRLCLPAFNSHECNDEDSTSSCRVLVVMAHEDLESVDAIRIETTPGLMMLGSRETDQTAQHRPTENNSHRN